MAELEQDGRPIGGLPEPDPREGGIVARNERRRSRRLRAIAQFQSVQQTEAQDLDRFGDTRRVGGTFETLEAVPERTVPRRAGLSLADLTRFLGAFQFDAQSRVLGENSFLSSFGPNVLGLNRIAPATEVAPAEEDDS